MEISIATFNVHMWVDADYHPNYNRVLALVKKYNPDVLCIQECGREYNSKFTEKSDFKYMASKGSNAIFSKTKILKVYDFNGERNTGEIASRSLPFITIGISSKNDSEDAYPIYVTCIHLNYKDETIRLKEIESIKKKLDTFLPEESSQIWTGDFNELTKEDYTETEWEMIASVRKKNNWESPQTNVTRKVKEFGMSDCWQLVDEDNKIGPVKTCRFDTRIDYVVVNEKCFKAWSLKQLETVDDNASDHNMVIATFREKEQ